MAEEKRRVEVLLPKELLEEIDRMAGKRGRTKFIEHAVRMELRRRTFETWLSLGKKLKGLTLEDTLYTARTLEEQKR